METGTDGALIDACRTPSGPTRIDFLQRRLSSNIIREPFLALTLRDFICAWHNYSYSSLLEIVVLDFPLHSTEAKTSTKSYADWCGNLLVVQVLHEEPTCQEMVSYSRAKV